MIKKFLHYLCFTVASVLWLTFLAMIFRFAVIFLFGVDMLAPETYAGLAGYWNSGGILRGKDLLMILTIVTYLPVSCWGCYKLYRYKYLKLLTVPLNKILNRGLDGYVAPDVNIKNLKIEEKKTLEQIVQERLNTEKKKNQQKNNPVDLRQNIIERINETKK